jgi:hypothetical protein
VLANRTGVIGGIRINEPEDDAFARKLCHDPLNFRSVAVGDWTVGAREQEHDGFRAGRRLERIDRRAAERLNENGQEGKEHETMVHRKDKGLAPNPLSLVPCP